MPERIACEFYLLRYVPSPVREEFVNIGVLLRQDGRNQKMQVRLTRDWSRVLCIDPEADTAYLSALEDDLAEKFRATDATSRPFIEMLEDSLSGLLQLSGPRGVFAETLAAEMDSLMRLYVAPTRTMVEAAE